MYLLDSTLEGHACFEGENQIVIRVDRVVIKPACQILSLKAVTSLSCHFISVKKCRITFAKGYKNKNIIFRFPAVLK